ncbi:hypothetical protein [Cellulomonas dongxiuzhuiae]|uniref:Uncharacterized protein n=1 Tax=Cellulomonas dongxiuzhuiae TaxID=2819979 RepID=A0ABX8GN15_9CELL|nr:hypothetical protein [Cellulomonas dongxiuzhuiae]MBO3093303.1 hypothetical protein [Cellulomonas dongxiuzhuiae]QWC17588.1 hypothetical protein KKR89_08530 [Cellulomonas dongxiuzhuiae]
MDTIWWVLGAVVLVATLLDIVLAALNYDEDWDGLRTATAESTTALLAALEHRPVPTVREGRLPVRPAGPADQGDPGHRQVAVLRRVVRINQTLVLLVGRLAPDAVDRVDDDVPSGT